MNNTFTLSKKELELMEVLWGSGVPLSRTEILEGAASGECTWKPNSIHILVNSLMEKGALRVSGYYLNSRKLGRTFEPTLTREEYAAMLVVHATQEAAALLGQPPAWSGAVLQEVGALSN